MIKIFDVLDWQSWLPFLQSSPDASIQRKSHKPHSIVAHRSLRMEAITITFAQTEDLNEVIRISMIQLCIAARQEEDLNNLFVYTCSGGWHFTEC